MMFFKKNKQLVQLKAMYAITKGVHLGDFYVFYGKEIHELGLPSKYEFVQLPDFKPISLTEKEVIEGLKEKVLDFVTILKPKAFATLIAEFQFRNNL